ncbi:hypothetical protein BZA70DRAFT_275663, partial [Myxozyma melibiosi]
MNSPALSAVFVSPSCISGRPLFYSPAPMRHRVLEAWFARDAAILAAAKTAAVRSGFRQLFTAANKHPRRSSFPDEVNTSGPQSPVSVATSQSSPHPNKCPPFFIPFNRQAFLTTPKSPLMNYAWVIDQLREQIEAAFTERLRNKQPLVDKYGRVFTANWRVPSSYRELARALEKPGPNGKRPDIRDFFCKRERSITELKEEALADYLVKIYSSRFPPVLFRKGKNELKMRLLDGINMFGTDIAVRGVRADQHPEARIDLSSQKFMSKAMLARYGFPIQWMIVSAMHFPLAGHDHWDKVRYLTGTNWGMFVTSAVYKNLVDRKKSADDLIAWIRCVRAPTGEEAIAAMDGKNEWPSELLLFTLMRKLTKRALRSIFKILSKHFHKLDQEAQRTASARIIRHIWRESPELLPKIAELFVKDGRDKGSETCNRMLYLLSVRTTINYPDPMSRVYLLEAQQTLLRDMQSNDIILRREGYLSLAAFARYEDPQGALHILDTMTKHGMPLERTGETIRSMISLDVEQNKSSRYIPGGKYATDLGKLSVVPDLYTATKIYEELPGEAQNDHKTWNVLLKKVIEFESLKPEAVFDLLQHFNETGVTLDRFLVQKLMSVLNSADDGIKLLSEIEPVKVRTHPRVVRSFIMCCHRDPSDPEAMIKAQAVLDEFELEHTENQKLLNSILAYRRWKLREYQILALNGIAEELKPKMEEDTHWAGSN